MLACNFYSHQLAFVCWWYSIIAIILISYSINLFVIFRHSIIIVSFFLTSMYLQLYSPILTRGKFMHSSNSEVGINNGHTTCHMTSCFCLIQELDSEEDGGSHWEVWAVKLHPQTHPFFLPLPSAQWTNMYSSVDYLHMYGYVCTCVCAVCACMYTSKCQYTHCSLATCIKCM